MSKWMTGCLLALLVLAGMVWWGYRRMAAFAPGSGPLSVGIEAPPGRVFASLANGDSIVTWMAQGNVVTVKRHGPLVVGDSLRVQIRSMPGLPQRALIWTVSEVVPNKLLALEMRADTSRKVMAIRRDSLVEAGDSTLVLTSVSSPVMDSAQTARGDTASRATMLDMTSKLLISSFRMEAKLELLRLKARVEGRPMPGAKR
jgi:uncharacterized protein YndB with AHSA1/START domain